MISVKEIDLIVYDFDGVMTDNKVIVREDGLESVSVNRSDGLAVEKIKKMEVRQLILSKEQNRVVEIRARKLDIPVLQGVNNKNDILRQYCMENSIDLSKVVYVGNDINDVDVMRIVGHPFCPQDAYLEARKIAKFVIPVNGGDGVVRELLNYIKECQEA